MSSDEEIAKLEEQLCQALDNKVRWDAEVKAEAEHTEEKAAVGAKRVDEEKAAAEVEAQQRVVAALNMQAMEAEACQVTKEKVAAAAAAR